jgi:BlaI family penicillinase repressor
LLLSSQYYHNSITNIGKGPMPRKKEKPLGNLELKVMSVVWDLQKATVREVKNALPGRKPLAYTTVLSVMQVLEKKGFLRHEPLDRRYVYHPMVSREEVVKSNIKHLANRLFDGSAELLVVNVLESQDLRPEELKRLKQLITAKERQQRKASC